MFMMFGSRVAALAEWRIKVAANRQTIICAGLRLLALIVSLIPVGSGTYACTGPPLVFTQQAAPCSMQTDAPTGSGRKVVSEVFRDVSKRFAQQRSQPTKSWTLTPGSVGLQQCKVELPTVGSGPHKASAAERRSACDKVKQP